MENPQPALQGGQVPSPYAIRHTPNPCPSYLDHVQQRIAETSRKESTHGVSEAWIALAVSLSCLAAPGTAAFKTLLRSRGA